MSHEDMGDGKARGGPEKPSSAPAQKGCAKCDRRRIRCDLQKPECQKCIRKGLKCPGYGRKLRWVEGVAARGHLRGRRVPTTPGSSPPGDQSHAPDPANTQTEQDVEVVHREPSDVDMQRWQLQRQIQRPLPGMATNFSVSNLMASTARFLDYYQQNLAGLMVWLDSDENAYRRTVAPMGEIQPAIGFAIMAFAAQHGAIGGNQEGMDALAEFARDRCLEIIQQRARDMTNQLTQGQHLRSASDIADAEWMLASILIMANYENNLHRPTIADAHRRAARTIVNLFKDEPAIRNRGLFSFLRNQLVIDDVIAASTSFDVEYVRNAITPGPESDHIMFSQFLRLLHEVTLLSREIPLRDPSVLYPPHKFTVPFLRLEFEMCRGATLMAAGSHGLQPPSDMFRDFVRLVDTYHTAGLLYSFHCLELVGPDHAEWVIAVSQLFDQLMSFDNHTPWLHVLGWPVFIAGTACHGNPGRQSLISGIFKDIYRATKFGQHRSAIQFLDDFWAGIDTDWRPLAYQREMEGRRILVT